jgi:orotate phosphoribosyltransferase
MRPPFVQSEFDTFVVDNRVIGFFEKPITLKSGRTSNWYVNWRTVVEDAFLLDQLSDYVLAYARSLIQANNLATPDCFYGVPEGATKLGVITQFKWAKASTNFAKGSHVVPMGRAKPKEHGVPKDRFFVGEPRGKVVVLEDVTTTGGSLIETIDRLLTADIDVIAAFGLTNRMERRDDGASVEAAIERIRPQRPIRYFAMSAATDLLPIVMNGQKPDARIIEAIQHEFSEFGVKPLKRNAT